ncbi:type III polyketide synthase, partial [Mycobacterium kansasii]
GPKIIGESARSLGISTDEVAPSWEILDRFGNMLSVSLLFVLDLMVQQAKDKSDISTGMAFSFAPGVAVEGMLFDIIGG